MNGKSRTMTAAKDLRAKALDLAQRSSTMQLQLAEVLYHTFWDTVRSEEYEIPIWEIWKFESWNDYVEGELGLHTTSARQLRHVHETFEVQLAGKWDRSLVASVTKMKALCRVVRPGDVNDWLRRAKKLTCCQLDEAINAVLYGEEERQELRTFAATLTPKEMKKVKASVERVCEELNITRGEALVRICADYEKLHAATQLRSRAKTMVASA